MSRSRKIQEILAILKQRLESDANPGLVGSAWIAEKIHLSIAETKQLLRIMDERGVVLCNVEAEYSIITQAGISSV